MINTQYQNHGNSSYSNLQKQLDQEHKRLLKERQQILSRESEKLQLYQKIDLVDFFSYEPSESESSKEEIMYHLSEKFKNYMRKFSQNNVYKQVSYLVNSDRQRQRSVSKSKGKTNVQKNSDLGRMFQTDNLYRNQYQENTIVPSVGLGNQKEYQARFYAKTERTPRQSINQHQGVEPVKKLFKNDPTTFLIAQLQNINNPQNNHSNLNPKNNASFIPNSQVIVSAQQLSHALDQQQKIYLLAQLNYYIKLYKESQTKKQFMSKHLENLHEYLVDVRLKYHSKVKTKSKTQPQSKPYSMILQENQLLKRQIQTYKKELQTFNRMENQEFFDKINDSNPKSAKKFIQVKKIDRFKQFAQHIQIMQDQLTQLIITIQTQPKVPSYDSNNPYVRELQEKVKSLEHFISGENDKKNMFLEQVKKFKEIMKKKDQEIYDLKKKLISSQNFTQDHQLTLQMKNFNNFDHQNYEKSRSKTKYASPRKSIAKEKENFLSNRQDEFDRFIDSALKSTNNQHSHKSIRYSRITTKQPSQTGVTNYELERSSHKRISLPYEHINEVNFDLNSNKGSRTTYHSRIMEPSTNLTSRERDASISKSRHPSQSSSRSRSKTNFLDDYEPRPYERYNNLSEYTSGANLHLRRESEMIPLYNRITQPQQRDYSKSHF